MKKISKNDAQYSRLKKTAESMGIDLFGVADVASLKQEFAIDPRILKNMNRAVSVGMCLSGGILSEIDRVPTRLYFHHYRTLNALLDQTALKLSRFIEKQGFIALPIPASQIVDWQKQTAHLSHKKIALMAGIGWLGRNNLLVTQEFGSRFRLATILTNMPLKADKPLVYDCGSCSMCVALCPANAIKENPSDFDHIACFEKLKEFQKQRLVDQYICGVCVRACGGKHV